jgi:DNA-directed RNA polymerase alpha subunit
MMSEPIDVLPEQSHADQSWDWADKNGMERELYYALAEPWEKDRSIRVLYALANARVLTRAQIVEMGRDKLLMVRNLGPKGIAFIRQRLNEAANR